MKKRENVDGRSNTDLRLLTEDFPEWRRLEKRSRFGERHIGDFLIRILCSN